MAIGSQTTGEPQAKEFVDPLSGKTYNRTTFADEVRGTEAKPLDFTMAKLAQDVYKSHEQSRPPIDGWTPLNSDQLRQVGIDPKLLHDKKSGYDAAVYTDNDGRYVVSYRGTDQAKDWKTNLGQGLGFDTTQYNLAAELGRKAKDAFGENVAFVGHSLGGGLAASAMAATDVPGMTFNAAGLSEKTLKRLGFEPDAVKEQVEHGQIRNYQVKGEILTHLQEKNIATRWVMPDAIGRDMPLPDPNPLKGLHNINPFEKVPHRVDLHSMSTVLESWQMKHGNLLTQSSPAQTGPAMSDTAHPANASFERANGELGPKLQSLGLTADQSRAVTADLTLQAQRDGVTPVRFEMGKDQQRVFAVPEGEAKPYSQVTIGESKDKSFVEISRESATLATPAPAVTNDSQTRAQATPTPPDQGNQELGSLAIARGAR
ncbi:MAG: DUF2974 domain-containing protein [Lysobacter sp.]|nr:DUF2974 domain-containing protein [Lysobacter sp.]